MSTEVQVKQRACCKYLWSGRITGGPSHFGEIATSSILKSFKYMATRGLLTSITTMSQKIKYNGDVS